MERAGHLLDSDGFKALVHEALEICGQDPALLMYYQWALAHKRSWSPTFAAWCQVQEDLSYPKITQRWRERGAYYRDQDLRERITAANQKRSEQTEQAEPVKPLEDDYLPI